MTAKKRQVARSPEDLEKKRNLILDAAMALLAEKGFPKITMSDVAKTAGIGRGTVYWHFDSKDDLFFAAVMREVDRVESGMNLEHLPERPLDALVQLINVTFNYVEEAPNFIHLFLTLMAGAGDEFQVRLHELFSEMYGKYDAVVEAMLEAGKADGSVRSDLDSKIAAAAIVAMLDGMFLQLQFGQVPPDPERLAAAVLDLVQNGFASAGGPK